MNIARRKHFFGGFLSDEQIANNEPLKSKEEIEVDIKYPQIKITELDITEETKFE